MVRSHRTTGTCQLGSAVHAPHWHHTCWQCGADVCGGTMALPSFYTCRCGCGENDSTLHIPTEAGFNREFAARASCP